MESGLEVLFSSIQNDIISSDDALVSAVHWCIISNGFKCVGKGENPPENVNKTKKSELLPKQWNNEPGVYCLLYQDIQNDVYLLKVISMDGSLMVHFMRFKDDKVGDTLLKVSDYSTDDLSSYENVFKNLNGLEKKIKSEVLQPFLKSQTTGGATGSTSSKASSSHGKGRMSPDGEEDPLRVRQPGHAHRSPAYHDPQGPFSVGRGDLDPLAGPMAGGMLMDPMRGGFPGGGMSGPGGGLGMPGRLPRGAVPPGARFDPIGPPDLDGSGGINPRGGFRAGPDPDHMRPPGFEDDMFM